MRALPIEEPTVIQPAVQDSLLRHLDPTTLDELLGSATLQTFEVGETLSPEGQLPAMTHILLTGRARALGDSQSGKPTIQTLQPGTCIGWEPLLRRVPYGSVRAASLEEDVQTLAIPSDRIEAILPLLLPILEAEISLLEVYDLLDRFLGRLANRSVLPSTKDLADYLLRVKAIKVCHWFVGDPSPLAPEFLWLVSGGSVRGDQIGRSVLDVEQIRLDDSLIYPIRLVGVDRPTIAVILQTESLPLDPQHTIATEPEAIQTLSRLEALLQPPSTEIPLPSESPHYPGRTAREDTLAEATVVAFWNLTDLLKLPFRHQLLRSRVKGIDQKPDRLDFYSKIAEGFHMDALQIHFSASPGGFRRIQCPALLELDGKPCILYDVGSEAEGDVLTLAHPAWGVQTLPIEDVLPQLESLDQDGTLVEALVFSRKPGAAVRQFGWKWVLPYVKPEAKSLLLVLVASIFVQVLGLATPLLTQQIIDKVIINGSAGALPAFGILMLSLSIAQSVLDISRNFIFNSVSNRVDVQIASYTLRHLLRLPLSFFQRYPVGELSSRISELETIRSFLTSQFLTVIMDVLFSLIYIVVMLSYSPILTLCTLLTIPVILAITLFGASSVRDLYKQRADKNSALQSYLIETLNGVFTVKAQHREQFVEATWNDQYLKYLEVSFRSTMTSRVYGSINTLANTLSSLVVLWVGGLLAVQGDLTLGGLIAFRIIAGYVTGPLLRLAQLSERVQEVQLSINRLADVIDTTEEFSETDAHQLSLPPVIGKVELKNVSFGFQSTGEMQLSDVSLTVEPGQFVGLVGLSGSGKSTLVKLLNRLYVPQKGVITIDDYDINKVTLDSLRQQVGMVPQEPLLFDASVRDNIDYEGIYTDAQVIEAAQLAEAHDFIEKLPQGYATPVGERGSRLSGGQRQRIAIAQVILQNPRLVILDEATSALDYETERRVVANLMKVFKGKTVFCITHRLANLRQADQIFYLQSGAIVERGTHVELMAQRQLYYTLYSQQSKGD
ncbi:peptidase domain-containing ABC transporter [Leptolyngbya ohadii]|uniref:peptidase domain-containing ABC transporter n=1 Tax=Leptolyngbya ohadii TaxID=1962290 RepID=UPI000B59BC6B|nr:peptidase domain-containing ABC transporter [Leptolyngbya ohadii]